MDSCDVLIAGGGPAGSACAWALRHSGLDTAILDKQTFPRDKVCGGWITPAVVTELDIDLGEYSAGNLLQPITGFRTGSIGGSARETDYGAVISYGIRRREFDDFLLRRSGARLILGTPLSRLERAGKGWIVNGSLQARLLVGAGGHFCPVARLTGAKSGAEDVVAAQETEFEMDPEQAARCRIRPEMPELYFCRDLKGYGWCFRKRNFVNVGLGRMDRHRLAEHVAGFLHFLDASGRLGFEVGSAMAGHAYLLYGASCRKILDDQLLLIGDAAGLAYAQSGEGIRPAIESGLLAAKAILAAGGDYRREALEPYRRAIEHRFGTQGHDWAMTVGRHLPASLVQSLGRAMLGARWFSKGVVLDRWFLHAHQPALY